VSSVALGPFLLSEEIGSGGMGAVWGGRHGAQGVPVAVKVLHARFAETPWFLESFRNEVRSVARLRHPSIVTVFDHGEVDAAAAAASGGKLEVGSPWLAMERVPGKPLSRLVGRLEWPALRRVLLGLLDALAHAHARGVVHRDIKPGNAMATADRAVLVDFGLAHWMKRALDPEVVGQVAGTAAYMAPEQFRGDDADFGPWTDLYAMGCLTWALACGRPPFGRRAPFTDLQRAHLEQPVPPLEPLISVPDGFEPWLRTLLHKNPARRFQRAAEAAWALEGLADQSLNDPDVEVISTRPLAEATTRINAPSAPEVPAGIARISPRHPRPPLPARWTQPSDQDHSIRLTGAGLRLFGLRSLPVVGREAERTALWGALGEVAAGQTRAVLLHGLAGTGKSMLAGWLCERSDELGQTEVIEVTHGEVAGPSDGLAPAIARWLRVAGLPEGRLDARLDTAVARFGGDETDRQTVEALATGSGFASAHARHAALYRLLGRVAEQRPVVLRLEDVQWGTDALAFAAHVLQRHGGSGPPLLMLMTCREVARDTVAARLLERLMVLPGARRVEVGPLPPGRRSRLISELLHLEGELAEAVERRTNGNPLYIVQLVGDWVQRGVLEPGVRGFQLRDGALAELPDDLHAVWQHRVARALRDRGELEKQAVQLAAFLGVTVDAREWSDASRAIGAWASTEVVEDLFTAGLAQPDPRGAQFGWTFVHGMLRESLVRGAVAEGRDQEARRGCVEMLRERHGSDARVALRLGSHLLALGEPDEAVAFLTQGAWDAVRDSEYLAAEAALEEREQALDALGSDAESRRRVDGWIMRARVARRRDHPSAAADWTSQALALARAGGWPDLCCQALREQARIDLRRGARQAAIGHLDAALVEARRADDALAAAWVRRDLGLAHLESGGDVTRVVSLLRAAETVFRDQDEVFGVATCRLGRGVAARRDGDALGARQQLEAASATFRRSLDVQEPAHAWVGLAEVARERGDSATALERYARARQRFDEIGHPGPDALPLHQARVEIDLGLLDAAVARLQGVLRRWQSEGREQLMAGAFAHLAVAMTAAGRLREARRFADAAAEIVEDAREPDAELAEVAADLGVRAERAGDAVLTQTAGRLVQSRE
jgi:eukaryotic-like serine/threonine-protein kinase